MNEHHLFSIPLEELAARVVFAGQGLSAALPVNQLAADARQDREIRSLLRHVAGDDATGTRARECLEMLTILLATELETETLGFSNHFDGRNDPHYGAVGAVYVQRILTERGELIRRWRTRLHGHLRMVRILGSRMTAEAAVNRRFSV